MGGRRAAPGRHRDHAVEMSGTLWLCGTPIGNLEDMTDRLRRILGSADVVYAEDTRRARVLLEHAGSSARLRSYFVGNESSRAQELQDDLRAGKTVAFVTDAGMPGVGDPGLTAVLAAREIGAAISIVPGPSAVTSAVALAGLGDRFAFESFLPRKGKERTERLRTLASEQRATVIFCSPKRILADLSDLAAALGADREIFAARELTKMFEELWWGTLEEAIAHWTDTEPRGEFTLVIRGTVPSTSVDWQEALAVVEREVAAGTSRAAAVREVADMLGVPKNELYRRATAAGTQ